MFLEQESSVICFNRMKMNDLKYVLLWILIYFKMKSGTVLGSNNEHYCGNGCGQCQEMGKLVFSRMAALLVMVGRAFPPWCRVGGRDFCFSAYDAWGLGKKIILVFLWVEQAMQKTSCQMRNNLIWLFKLLQEEALAVATGARQGSTELHPVVSPSSVCPPGTPVEFIYSSRPNAAYKLWLRNPHL